MNSKFYEGQLVRVIGADWTFRALVVGFISCVYCRCEEPMRGISVWWPEYLLESDE